MAPKRAPSAKSRRSTRRSQKRGQFRKELSETSGIYISTMLCLVLLVITASMLILCIQQWKKIKTFRAALKVARNFVISVNPGSHPTDDMGTIEVCQGYVEELLVWDRKIAELQSAISDISFRLNRDWEAHRGFIYLFYEDRMIWNEAKHFCQRYDSHLVTIDSKFEEEYIEGHIQDATVNYWAGGIKKSISAPWIWIENGTIISTVDVYWANGEPQETAAMNCIVFLKKCQNPLKCWYSHNCFTFNRPLCKKRPEKDWFN